VGQVALETDSSLSKESMVHRGEECDLLEMV
jgi:hypothetical protein